MDKQRSYKSYYKRRLKNATQCNALGRSARRRNNIFMANQWIRLWVDLPNDPKWRTIARVSKQPITAVVSVYVHMLVVAANNHGDIDGWEDEDVASALDMEESDIAAIREAMQGRVLSGKHLSGWEKRQPKREETGEDGINKSTERSRKNREKQRFEANQEIMQRTGTQCNAPDTDTDTDTEYKNTVSSVPEEDGECLDKEIIPEQPKEEKPVKNNYPADFNAFFQAFPHKDGVSKKRAYEAWRKARDKPSLQDLLAKIEILKRSDQWLRGIIPHPSTWLNGKCWETVGSTPMQGQIVDHTPRPEIFDPATVFGEGFKLEY